MIQSLPIKKEIIKTFLKNVNRPIEEISSIIFKHLDKAYLRGEKMIYNNTQCVILRRDQEKYKVRLENLNIIDVEAIDLKRAEPIGKNMLYGFLIENTTQTIFGRVLKLNVYNDITKGDAEKEVNSEQGKLNLKVRKNKNEKKTQKPIVEYLEVNVKSEKKKFGKIFENREDLFELFIFYGRFNDFLSFNITVTNFENFINEINTPHFKFMVCKEFMKVIRVDKNEEYFNDLITTSLEINVKMIEQIKNSKVFVKDDKVDWKNTHVDKSNWMQVVKSFLFYAVQVNKAAAKLIDTCVFENDFEVLLKFITDIIIHCSSFKVYFDKTVEKLRRVERERYDLNVKYKKIDSEKSKEENEKYKKEHEIKLAEMDKYIINNRLKPRFFRYADSDYYFVCSDIYYTENQNVHIVDKSLRNEFMKNFRGKKEASSIVSFCKNVCEVEKNVEK